MVAAGRTQTEIARQFRRSERTIRNWYRAARQRQIMTFRDRSAEEIIADIEWKFARSYSRWMSILNRAQAAGDLRLEIEAQSRMDQTHVHRVRALEKVGYFEGVKWMPKRHEEQDSVTQGQQELQTLLEMMTRAIKGEENRTSAGPPSHPGFEPLY